MLATAALRPRLPRCSCRPAYIWLDAHASTSTAAHYDCVRQAATFQRFNCNYASQDANWPATRRQSARHDQTHQSRLAPVAPQHTPVSELPVLSKIQKRFSSSMRQDADNDTVRDAPRWSSKRERLEHIQEIRRLRRTSHEARLAPYTYREPVGTIESMRTTSKERFWGALDSTLAQVGSEDITDPLPYKAPTVHIIDTMEEADRLLADIQPGEALSLDVEGAHNLSFQGKIGLVQIATDQHIYMLRIGMMKELPLQLIRVLDDEMITKCGVGIQGDSIRLMREHGHQVCNAIELSVVAKQVSSEHWSKWYSPGATVSLRDLCRVYLDRRLRDGRRSQPGQWQAAILNKEQIEYAANDAYVGIELLHAMARRRILEYTGESEPTDVLNHPCMDTVLDAARVSLPRLPPHFALLEQSLRDSYLADNDNDANGSPPTTEAASTTDNLGTRIPLTRPQIRAFVSQDYAAKRLQSLTASLTAHASAPATARSAERALERTRMEGVPDVNDLETLSSSQLAVAVIEMWSAGAELRTMEQYLPPGVRYVLLLALLRDYARQPTTVDDTLLTRLEQEVSMAREDGCFDSMLEKMESRLEKIAWLSYKHADQARHDAAKNEESEEVDERDGSRMQTEVKASLRAKETDVSSAFGKRKPAPSRTLKASSVGRSNSSPTDWNRLTSALLRKDVHRAGVGIDARAPRHSQKSAFDADDLHRVDKHAISMNAQSSNGGNER